MAYCGLDECCGNEFNKDLPCCYNCDGYRDGYDEGEDE
jgi:hypothetical protein